MRGVDQFATAPTDDIEAQMMVKRKPSQGATSGGLLIKDDGFEGFNSVGARSNQ